jgi:hypothetical protein
MFQLYKILNNTQQNVKDIINVVLYYFKNKNIY